MVEGHIESGEHSGLDLSFGHKVILGIIELKVDSLIDERCICVTQIIEHIETLGIIFQFCIFSFGWDKVHVILAFILGSVWEGTYMSRTCVATSGAYRWEMISLGGSFSNMGCRK